MNELFNFLFIDSYIPDEYVISVPSFEWYIVNIVTFTIFIYLLLLVYSNKNTKFFFDTFTKLLGFILFSRIIGEHLYFFLLGKWTIVKNLPLQLCSFSSWISAFMILTINNKKISDKTRNVLFDFLFFWGCSGYYSFISPKFPTGGGFYRYIDYFVSHGSFLFAIIYMIIFFNFKPSRFSWIKIFLYSQIIVLIVHLINLKIGSNYIYTIGFIGGDPDNIIAKLVNDYNLPHFLTIDIFALIHFYFFYVLFNIINTYITNKNFSKKIFI